MTEQSLETVFEELDGIVANLEKEEIDFIESMIRPME